MAREHGRILMDLWADPDWRARTSGAQRLYFLLVSQRSINTCGVLPLQVSKWARAAADTTPADIDTALAELTQASFVIVDRDTEEVLVRTFIRDDGVAKQPNVLKNALRNARHIESAILRAELAQELRRLDLTIATEAADEIDPPPSATHREPIPKPSETPPEPFQEPSRTLQEPLPIPSRTDPKPTPIPSETDPEPRAGTPREAVATPGGIGIGIGVVSRSVDGDFKDLPPSAANTIIGEWLDRCAKRPPARVVGHVAAQVKALLAEGVDPDDIRAGLAAWTAKGLHPSVLPSVVNEVMNRAPPRPPPATTDRRTAAVQALKAQFRDHPTNQRQLPAGGDP